MPRAGVKLVSLYWAVIGMQLLLDRFTDEILDALGAESRLEADRSQERDGNADGKGREVWEGTGRVVLRHLGHLWLLGSHRDLLRGYYYGLDTRVWCARLVRERRSVV